MNLIEDLLKYFFLKIAFWRKMPKSKLFTTYENKSNSS